MDYSHGRKNRLNQEKLRRKLQSDLCKNMDQRPNQDTGLTPQEEEELLCIDLDDDILLIGGEEDLLLLDEEERTPPKSTKDSNQGSSEPGSNGGNSIGSSSSNEVMIIEDSPVSIVVPTNPSNPLNLDLHGPENSGPGRSNRFNHSNSQRTNQRGWERSEPKWEAKN